VTDFISPPVVTATPEDSSVDLSWTPSVEYGSSSGVTIYCWATTPLNPTSIGPPPLGNVMNSVVPFSDGPDGQQSKITIHTIIPGTGTMHMEVWDLTNQVSFGPNVPIAVVDNNTGLCLFQGLVQKVKYTPQAVYRLITVDAVDLNYICDTTLVGVPDGTVWESTVTSTGTVYTNVDPNADKSSPKTLFPAYWGYFIDIDTDTYVMTGPGYEYPGSFGPPKWDRITLRNAMDNLAGMCGPEVTWWLDQGTPGHANLHWTSFGSVTNISLIGVVGLPGVQSGTGGGLTMLMPIGFAGYTPTMGQFAAPYAITDQEPDYVTSWDYENFSVELDYSGFRVSLYVRGGTDYTTTNGGPPYVTGGTGWVGLGGPNGGDGGSSYLADFYDQPNAVDHGSRNALGTAALELMQEPIVRGTADCIGPGLVFTAGQVLTVTNTPLGINGAQFFIMGCTTSFLSGDDVRRCALEWGTAAKLNTAQRAGAGKNVIAPPAGATGLSPSAGDATLAAGNSTVVSTQLTNSDGTPWAIAGKTVTWSCQVLTDAGADVTATTTFTLVPTSSTTDASGRASTVLTTDPAVTGVRYLVSGVAAG